LKSINHPIPEKDPGEDASVPTDGSVDVSTDLFGMTLEYFEGDYERGDTQVTSLEIDDTEIPQQHSGKIRSMIFASGEEMGEAITYPSTLLVKAYDPLDQVERALEYIDIQPDPGGVFDTNDGTGEFTAEIVDENAYSFGENKGYFYKYDHKNQLKEAQFSAVNDFANRDRARDVVVDEYDANGNIKQLDRWGIDEQVVRDDFDYGYEQDKNQLDNVTGYVDKMKYNEIGQLTEQDFPDPTMPHYHISYDVTGKVTGVYKDAEKTDPWVEFEYDDRGFRIAKKVGEWEEWYVRDASGQVMAIYNKVKVKKLGHR